MRSSRIHRYVLAELSGPTFLGLFVWTFLLLMNHMFFVAEKALSKNLGWELTSRLFLSGVPNLLIMSIPMAVILGCLIGVGRLSADHEWVALQSAGHGPRRLLVPVALHGLLASLVAFGIYAAVVPRANYALRNLRGEILYASHLAGDLRPGGFYTQLPNVVLFVDNIRSGTASGRLEGVLLVEEPQATERTTLTLARRGDLYPAPDASGALILDLEEGVSHTFRQASTESYRASTFGTFRYRIETPPYLKSLLTARDKVVQDLTPLELWEEYREARDNRDRLAAQVASAGPTGQGSELQIAEHRLRFATADMHQRLALPLASFIFAVLALPLGITRVRSGKGAGFAMSLLILLIYWAAFTFFRDQASIGRFPAALGPWMGNLVLLPWAVYGLWRLRRPPTEGTGPLLRTWSLSMRAAGAVASRVGPATQRAAADDDEAQPEAVPLADLVSGTPNRFVARLDHYVGKHYLRILALAVVSAYLIYALVESKNLVDSLLRTQQSMSLLFEYFKYFVPIKLPIILPISCLVAAVVTFTLLTRTGELTAIKAVGVSMQRVSAPVLALTAMLSGVLFLVEYTIAPAANRRAEETKDQIMGRAPRTHGMPLTGGWAFGPQGERLYHYRLYDSDREEFQGLRVFSLDRSVPRILDHRFAERARWRRDHWELEGSWWRTFGPEGAGIEQQSEQLLSRVELDPPEHFASRELNLTSASDFTDEMTLPEITAQIDALRDRGYDTTHLQVAYHGKLSQAITPVVMVLLGLPFAFRVGRRGSLYGIGVALLLVLVYWATYAMFNALGLESLLDARAAAWAPNALYALLGVYLMLYVRT